MAIKNVDTADYKMKQIKMGNLTIYLHYSSKKYAIQMSEFLNHF